MPDIKDTLPKGKNGKVPSWLLRALNPNNPETKGKETIRSSSSEYNGKEILYPTIRFVKGKLVRYSDKVARQIAIERGDYIEFDSPADATNASKKFSRLIGQMRDN